MKKFKDRIPVSISELNYKSHNLFKYIMGGLVLYLLLQFYFLAAAMFAGVYVFRYFHMTRQKYFHYAFAIAGFAAVAWISEVYWPLLLGSGLYILHKVKKTNKEVFWFEMGAGIPYLFII